MDGRTKRSAGRPARFSQASGSQSTRKSQTPKSQPRQPRETHEEPAAAKAKPGRKRQSSQGASQSQRSMTQFLEDPSQSQKASKVPPITDDQVLEQARVVVYYMVASSRDGSTITRGDIQKTVLKNFHTKHFVTIMSKAAEVLRDVFAMEMKNLDGEEERYDKLILLDTQNIVKEVEDEEEKITQTLLLLVLNCIQVAGDKIKEEHLLSFFKELGISYSKHDDHFGDVEAKMNSFKSQAYVKFDTDKSTNPPTKIIAMGPRAKAEINNFEMMAFSKKLYPDLAFLSESGYEEEAEFEEEA